MVNQVQDYEFYNLEDNHDYLVVDTFGVENVIYKILSEVNNHRNICVRKITVENDIEYLSKLDEEEYDRIIYLLGEKYKNLFE